MILNFQLNQQLNKQEAIEAMIQGHTVTHLHFVADESMTMRRGKILFEDGITTTPQEFFSQRQQDSWNTGYTVVQLKSQ